MRRNIEKDEALVIDRCAETREDELNSPLHVVPGVARCEADEKFL